MEALTRLVADSFARHGIDRPVDPRRLKWSRWFCCDSPHSLLVVPSKPGIFALAEEIAGIGVTETTSYASADREGHDFSRAMQSDRQAASAAAAPPRRMLAVLQFSEDDNMAFTLDRMFTYVNPMRSRLHSGHCFVRFVVIDDTEQRRSICAVLNQWMRNSAEKASGLSVDFSSSLEFTSVGRTFLSANAGKEVDAQALRPQPVAPHAAHPNSGANKNLHCPPFPSGF